MTMVFKFGGASVKNADAVRNVADIIENYREEKLVVVISAMGKTTNALEQLLDIYLSGSEGYKEKFEEIRSFHFDIIRDLFPKQNHFLESELENLFFDLEFYFEHQSDKEYDYLYDQIIGFGEILSTRIISHYLDSKNVANKWIDARNFIITDNSFRNAIVDWESTEKLICQKIAAFIEKKPVITQGFIGSSKSKEYTSLGREGSDYSAAIFAYALNAKKLMVWKDVPGILNADPKKFEHTDKFDELTYEEAIEMTYYGSKVLHPKTIKPLENKKIPMELRSFLEPNKPGTLIHKDAKFKARPIYITKENQVLLIFSSRDYSFMDQANLGTIFKALSEHNLHMSMMSISAISLYVCVDEIDRKIKALERELTDEFVVEIDNRIELLTIRHYHDSNPENVVKGREVVLETIRDFTKQYALKSN